MANIPTSDPLPPVQTDRQTLKGYFESGQIPTGDHFRELIESTVNIVDDGFSLDENGHLSLNSENLQASEMLEIGTGPKITLTGTTIQFGGEGQEADFQLMRLEGDGDNTNSSLNLLGSLVERVPAPPPYLRVNSEGKLGIGINAEPSERLHLADNLKVEGNIIAGTGLELGSAATVADMLVHGKVGLGVTPDISLTIGAPTTGLDYSNNKIHLRNAGSIGLSLGNDGSTSIGDNSLIINSAGNLGIDGEPSDSHKLNITGDLAVSGTIVNATGNTQFHKLGLGANPDQSLALTVGQTGVGLSEYEGNLNLYTNSSNRLTILQNGQVGLGVSPEISLAINHSKAGLNYLVGSGGNQDTINLVHGERVGLSLGTNGQLNLGSNGMIISGDGNVGIGHQPKSGMRLYVEGDLEVTGAIINNALSGTQDEMTIGSTAGEGRLTVDGRIALGTSEPGIHLAIGNPNAGLNYQNQELHLSYGAYPGVVLDQQGTVSIGSNSLVIDPEGNLSVGTDTSTKTLTIHGSLSTSDLTSHEVIVGSTGDKTGNLTVYGTLGIDVENPRVSLAVGSPGAGLHNNDGNLFLHSTNTNTIRFAAYKQANDVSSPPPTVVEEETPVEEVSVIVEGTLSLSNSSNTEPSPVVTENTLKDLLHNEIFEELFSFERPVEPHLLDGDGNLIPTEESAYYDFSETADVQSMQTAMANEGPVLRQFLDMFVNILQAQGKTFFAKKELFQRVEDSPAAGEEAES